MDKAFRELSGRGEVNLQSVVEQVSQDLLRAPIARIDQKLRSLRGNLFLDATLLVGTLASTIISGGNSLLMAATVAVAQKAISNYKDQKKEKQVIRELPSYFYWNATRRNR
jgi:hypothetical protein